MLARLTEFFTDEGTPWSRRLWDIGSLLSLEELWEAGDWHARGVLSQAACDWQRAELRTLTGPDVGLGERELRKELTSLLSVPLPEPSPARRRLREVIDHARPGYLDRWASAMNGSPAPGPERFARTVAAHLLDLGWSATHLRSWAARLTADQADLMRIATSAADLARRTPGPYHVLAALSGVPRRDLAESLPHWLSKAEVVAWLRLHGHSTANVRPGGGFLIGVTALDPYGAAEQVRQVVERMIARSSFLRRHRGGVVPLPHMWVAGHAQPIPFRPPARGADVLSLVTEGHLYQVSEPRSRVDDALELAAPVNQSPLGPAVAGAWAAIEALLSHPDDPQEAERSGKAVAADRLAHISACSWPRAELTALAHRHAPPRPDRLSEQLARCTTNLERATCVADALAAHGPDALDFSGSRTRHSDLPAARRMAALLQDPRRVLGNVVATHRITLRRLYRTRNVVLQRLDAGGDAGGVPPHRRTVGRCGVGPGGARRTRSEPAAPGPGSARGRGTEAGRRGDRAVGRQALGAAVTGSPGPAAQGVRRVPRPGGRGRITWRRVS